MNRSHHAPRNPSPGAESGGGGNRTRELFPPRCSGTPANRLVPPVKLVDDPVFTLYAALAAKRLQQLSLLAEATA